jgi:ABC-type metal ion transport system substrate-binding protein
LQEHHDNKIKIYCNPGNHASEALSQFEKETKKKQLAVSLSAFFSYKKGFLVKEIV